MLNTLTSYLYLAHKFLYVLLVLCCSHVQAQLDSVDKAKALCQSAAYEKARVLIDKAIHHTDTKNDYDTWYTRGYIYYVLGKQSILQQTYQTAFIDTCVVSALKSIQLDRTKEISVKNEKLIENSAILYHNLSKALLDSLNDVESERCYLRYKQYTQLVHPILNLKEKDIEYYKAVGSIFSELSIKNHFNAHDADIAITALQKVLALDPKNINANYNLGILFYNKGAALMRAMDYDFDLSQLDVLQENAKALFKQSLPFMNKVYELNPTEIKALDGLEGIYHALLDKEKETEFRLKREALQKNK